MKSVESVTDKILRKVHPTMLSENRRKAVILYIQTLIRTFLGCEVLPYGSVPLKTYLPDGDIDLTAFVGPSLEESLANDVVSVLQAEEHHGSSEFIVKDVQLIRAEVKIVKCIVQNIVVDISFNQLGGLCTLCFLEKVDRLIGKDHLFKRSIILVKAWCYYESRILGAHHALISTYALETLVLYIFHLFHSKLDGPSAVLYKFLDYFSKFDWDNYCVGLNGLVHLSSLPDIVVKKLENREGGLLLSDEFLRCSIDMFSVPSRGFDRKSRTFPPKHLNVIDPLKANNNLGRSVSKGNLFRIRSAFTYGARKLGQALSQEEGSIAEELSKFFSNTLDRHGNGQRPDVQEFCDGPFSRASLLENESYKAISAANSVSTNGTHKWDKDDNDRSSITLHSDGEGVGNCNERCHSAEASESPADVEYHLAGDAGEQASSNIHRLQIANDTREDMNVRPQSAPHLYFSGSSPNTNSSVKSDSGSKEKVSSVSSSSPQALLNARTKVVGCYENSLCDLNGEYESHLNSMIYGRSCYEHSSGFPAPLPPSQWDVIRRSLPYKRNGFHNVHTDDVGMIPRPGFYPNNGVVLVHPPSPTSFGMENFSKQRGTGTYIPNANHAPYRNHWVGKGGMNEQGPVRRAHHSPRYTSLAPFRQIDESIILDGTHRRRHEDRLEVNNAPHQFPESSSTFWQQIANSSQSLPPSPPVPASEELQSSSPALPVSSMDARSYTETYNWCFKHILSEGMDGYYLRRLLVDNSEYRLKDEDDFRPLSM